MAESSYFRILALPNKLITHITSWLPNLDTKNARLANSRLAECTILRFERVFITPNAIDIEAICEVAAQHKYAKQVRELVWVDSHFEVEGLTDHRLVENDEDALDSWENEEISQSGPAILTSADIALHDQLREEHAQIIATDAHAVALRRVLPAFINLRRIFITDRVDMKGRPLQPTPMLRHYKDTSIPAMWRWRRYWVDPGDLPGPIWRGLVTLVKALAASNTKVRTFYVDVEDGGTGIPWEFFDNSSNALNGLRQICANGLMQLGIAIDIAEHDKTSPALSRLPVGSLRAMLEVADHLNSLVISTTSQDIGGRSNRTEDARILQAIPMHCLRSLRRFALWQVLVLEDDLIQLFRNFPSTLRHVDFREVVILRTTWVLCLLHLKVVLQAIAANLEMRVRTTPSNMPQYMQMALDGGPDVEYATLLSEYQGGTTVKEEWTPQYYTVDV